MSAERRGNDRSGSPLHDALDRDIDETIGVRMGFDALVRTSPHPGERADPVAAAERYAVIKRFQEQALRLFVASLRRECEPVWARSVVGELPVEFGVDYHRGLSERQHRTPVFFRTDEPEDGKLSEIQCSGSGWGLAEQLHRLYCDNEAIFGKPKFFGEALSSRFARALEGALGERPRIHHLVDNASRPHGIRYFIQRTREHGLRYFSYDAEATASECNFVRSHDFISLPTHNYFAERLERCDEGRLRFDLPPSVLFDGKLIMAWPFWSRTRDHFDEGVRDLFPHTALLLPEGVELEDGRAVSIEDLARFTNKECDFYLKYAGTDIAYNWGSRSVYLLSSMSGAKRRALLKSAVEDVARGRPWILQRALRRSEVVSALARDGSTVEGEAYVKSSGFYGPDGLLGMLVMHQRFTKVHGGPGTIMSIVF